MALNQIRKRIESTKKTAQITNAMRMVSGAKYNRMVNEFGHYFDYSQKIKKMVAMLAKQQFDLLESQGHEEYTAEDIHFQDLLIERPIKKTGYLIITADKGLAGSYNSSILKATETMLSQDHVSKDEVVILAIGAPIVKFCKQEGYTVAFEQQHLSDNPSFIEVAPIVKKAVELFKNEVFDALYVCFNHHINAMSMQFRADQILPITNLEIQEDLSTSMQPTDFIFEPNQTDILDVLLPQFAESQIYGAILDAKLSEHSSRMNAMRSATDNANAMIDELKQAYHQQRQLKVTNEILEIIGGANALHEQSGGE